MRLGAKAGGGHLMAPKLMVDPQELSSLARARAYLSAKPTSVALGSYHTSTRARGSRRGRPER